MPAQSKENRESVSKFCAEIGSVRLVLAGHGLGYLCKGKIERPKEWKSHQSSEERRGSKRQHIVIGKQRYLSARRYRELIKGIDVGIGTPTRKKPIPQGQVRRKAAAKYNRHPIEVSDSTIRCRTMRSKNQSWRQHHPRQVPDKSLTPTRAVPRSRERKQAPQARTANHAVLQMECDRAQRRRVSRLVVTAEQKVWAKRGKVFCEEYGVVR